MRYAGFALVVAAACGEVKANGDAAGGGGPPKVDAIDVGPGVVDVFQMLPMHCSASDPDGDTLAFTWTTTLGSIAGTGADVMLDARDTDGDAMVTCAVDDGHGHSAIDVKTVTVSLPRAGLAAYYPFEGDARDASGNALDAQPGGAQFVPDRHGGAGKAARFVAGAAPIVLPGSPSFDATGEYTIALFVSLDDPSVSRGLLGKGSTNGGNYTFLTDVNVGGNKLQFQFQNQLGSSSSFAFSPSKLLSSTPIHVAAVFSQGGITTFVDGQVGNQVAQAPVQVNTEPVHVGDNKNLVGWIGTIDELRFYRRALTAQEIGAIAKSQLH